MNKVLDYIERHLDQPLDLTSVATEAHFSPFHFHRLFAAWMGETPGDYLGRRRLEVAALMLAARPDAAVPNVALEVGFGSGEALARAFKLNFRQSPSPWRRGTPQRRAAELDEQRSNPGQAQRIPDQARGRASTDHGGLTHSEELLMQVSLKQLLATRKGWSGPPVSASAMTTTALPDRPNAVMTPAWRWRPISRRAAR